MAASDLQVTATRGRVPPDVVPTVGEDSISAAQGARPFQRCRYSWVHSRLGRPAPALNARQQRRFEDAKRNRVPSHGGTPHDPQVLRPVPFRIPIRLPPPCTAVAPPKPSYSPTIALIRVRSKVVRAAHRCYAHRAQANYRAHLLEAREAWAHLIAHKARGAVRGGGCARAQRAQGGAHERSARVARDK